MEIVELIRIHAPITGEQIAERLGATRPTIRSDLGLLVMLGYIDAKPKVGYFPGRNSMKERSEAESIAGLKVRDVMGLPVVLRETASVSDAVVALFLENVGSLVVVDSANMLAGIVSRKDLLKVTLGNAQAASVLLGMVMTRYPNVVTVSPDDTVREALRKMIAHEVDGLPVVQPANAGEESGASEASASKLEVVGRMTKTTLAKLVFDRMEPQ
ncbi:helix-turn-helix transcriptional regulator [Cohnella fermenti]|uniref:Helix-turn-helix transcriptional regulator n=1 Tax=Cohnella fermenti TaxID=2565925 RepID=A0A4S4C9H9_9BACL|nr:helix-turn-helix transcriptional regulator [Cohnella fermenti]